jgi:hypothetical protein
MVSANKKKGVIAQHKLQSVALKLNQFQMNDTLIRVKDVQWTCEYWTSLVFKRSEPVVVQWSGFQTPFEI